MNILKTMPLPRFPWSKENASKASNTSISTVNSGSFATFNPNPTYQKVDIIRTGGDTVTYIQAGWLNFKFNKTKYAFIAYQPNDKSSRDLFVPFRDATSGKVHLRWRTLY